MISVYIALAVLLAAAILLLALARRAERDIAISARAAGSPVPCLSLRPMPGCGRHARRRRGGGSAMIQAGYSVETVQDVLGDIARVNNLPESEVLAFPNALLVSARGEGSTALGRWQPPTGSCSSPRSMRCSGQWMPLAPVSWTPAPRSSASTAFARCSPPTVRSCAWSATRFLSAALVGAARRHMDGRSLAGALGLVTGAALLVSERVPRRYGALITVAIAFFVALAVFLLLRAGWGSGILAALLAPLVVLLPGALLTTAVLELSTGHMISGAGRAAAGAMQLVLLGAGIVTAGALVGVPDFDFSKHPELLGPDRTLDRRRRLRCRRSRCTAARRAARSRGSCSCSTSPTRRRCSVISSWAACSRPSSARCA